MKHPLRDYRKCQYCGVVGLKANFRGCNNGNLGTCKDCIGEHPIQKWMGKIICKPDKEYFEVRCPICFRKIYIETRFKKEVIVECICEAYIKLKDTKPIYAFRKGVEWRSK